MRRLGELQAQSKAEGKPPLNIGRDAEGSLAERIELFPRGRTCYQQRQWQQARALFEELLKRWPDDGPAGTFWKRCQEYLFEEPEAGWDAVFVTSHK